MNILKNILKRVFRQQHRLWPEPHRFGGTTKHIDSQLDIVSSDVNGFTMAEYIDVPITNAVDGLLDVEGFNADSITLRAKGESVTIPYPAPGDYSQATLKDGTSIIYVIPDS